MSSIKTIIKAGKTLENLFDSDFVFGPGLEPPRSPLGKQKRLSPVRLQLLETWKGVLAYNDEKYSLSGLYVDYAKNEQPAQLKGVLTGERLRGLMEGKNHYAAMKWTRLSQLSLKEILVF